MSRSDRPVLPPGVTIRLMRDADIPAGVALCRMSRWNQTAGEWTLFLDVARGAAFVAERAGAVVGTALRVPYAPDVEWVAMVLVDPAERGRGIGRALLVHVIASVPAGHVARLDATPAGRPLYAALGFKDEFGLVRWRRSGRVAGPPESAGPGRVAQIEPGDWPAIAALDVRTFGAARLRVLEWCSRAAPDYAWVSHATDADGGGVGAIDGFVLGRHGHDTEHIGPVVAASTTAARDLVTVCLARARRPEVSLDVPDVQDAFSAWLRDAGFAVERPFMRMRRGTPVAAGVPAQVFAVVGPEFG